MTNVALIDYGCHGFTHRLATNLSDLGYPMRYFANGSLESPNLKSLPAWRDTHPASVRIVVTANPYGKMGLRHRLQGELQWAKNCLVALEKEDPSAIILSTVPLAAAARIFDWADGRGIPLVYWLQDLQGRAIHELLGTKLGKPGRVLGAFAHIWEQHLLEKSRMIITIAPGHEQELPPSVRESKRYSLLENWADLEQFPEFPQTNEWAIANGLHQTLNIMYSGTLGLKHDLSTFIHLASALRNRADVRIVVISSGQAADTLKEQASEAGLPNLIVLPFQPYKDVPMALASAAVFIAPLEASAGSFCVPSKVLSYYCAGRPTVLAIDAENPAARTIAKSGAGRVVTPGDHPGFIRAVEEYLNDKALREAAGQRARRYAEETFRIDRVTEKFLSILSAANIKLDPDKKTSSLAAAS